MPTPLTVEFIGSRIDAADATTNYTATKIAGGGSGPSAQTAAVVQQGSFAIGMTYPAAPRFTTLHFDDGVQTWDFSSGGTDEGSLLWIWANALLAMESTGTITSTAVGGLGIIVTDQTAGNIDNSYAGWTFYGSENYPGGFQKLVIDPTLRPTFSGGTFAASSLANIRGVGLFFVGPNVARGGADCIALDAIDIGSGLRIYGSGTPDAGFKDLLDADFNDVNNQYGVIRPLGGTEEIVQFQGVIEVGSGVNATTVFDDINRVVSVRSPEYIATDGTTRFAPSIRTDFQKIKIVGNSTSGTFVTLGEKVGVGDTARGRNGVTFLGNDEFDVSFSFDDGNVDQTRLYGTTIRNFNGTLDWSLPESGHEFVGSIIDGCSQYNASSGVVIRNSTFQNHTGNDGAFLYNSGTDIKNSNFLANANSIGSGAAIQHPFSGSFIYDNLTFSDNDFDINFSLSTSGDLVIQATNGADPSSSKKGNANSTVDIQNTVLLTLTDIIVGSEVRLYKSNPTGTFPVELAGTEAEDDGIFEYAYNFTGNFDADIVVVNTGYVYFRQNDNTLTNTPATIKINQVFDRNYENP